MRPRASKLVCHPALRNTGWLSRGATSTIVEVPLAPLSRRRMKTQEGRVRNLAGHEATDTGLAYAPVSQAHGHHHTV